MRRREIPAGLDVATLRWAAERVQLALATDTAYCLSREDAAADLRRVARHLEGDNVNGTNDAGDTA